MYVFSFGNFRHLKYAVCNTLVNINETILQDKSIYGTKFGEMAKHRESADKICSKGKDDVRSYINNSFVENILFT